MFETYCPVHGSNVIIFPSSIDGLVNTDHGIEVHYHCTCGHRGMWLTGKRSPANAA